MGPVAALQAAALTLLRAEGHEDAARILEGGELILTGASEAWAMGDRVVQADRLVLVLETTEWLEVQSAPELLAQAREALSAAMHSDQTRLRSLDCCLRLPHVGEAWRDAYRTAARFERESPLEPESVLHAARALLEAAGQQPTARLLDDARLELAELPGSSPQAGHRRMLRAVLRLPPATVVSLRADRDRLEAVRRAITDAANRPLVTLADLSLGLLGPL